MNEDDLIRERKEAERWEFYRRSNRREVIEWAQNIFEESEKHAILTTRQKGFRENREIQLVISNIDQSILYDIEFYGVNKLDDGHLNAYRLDGYLVEELSPLFEKIVNLDKLNQKQLLSYNAAYQLSVIRLLIENNFCSPVELKGHCIQKVYSQFVGALSRRQVGYILQELPNRGADAYDDCNAIIEVLREMANAEVT